MSDTHKTQAAFGSDELGQAFDPGLAGSAAFAAWKNQVVSLATIQHPRDASHYGTLLQALFTSVIIHGRDADEEFSVETKRASKFDTCG